MLAVKELDLIHRSEIGYESYMLLWELSRMKGDHNDPFVVTKKNIAEYLEGKVTEKISEDGNPVHDTLGTLNSITVQMKTNNLYVQ